MASFLIVLFVVLVVLAALARAIRLSPAPGTNREKYLPRAQPPIVRGVATGVKHSDCISSPGRVLATQSVQHYLAFSWEIRLRARDALSLTVRLVGDKFMVVLHCRPALFLRNLRTFRAGGFPKSQDPCGARISIL